MTDPKGKEYTKNIKTICKIAHRPPVCLFVTQMFLSSQTLFWCQPCVPKSLLWTFTHTHPGKVHQKFCLTLPHPFFQISSYCRIVGRRGGSDHLPLISSHDSLSPQFPKPVLFRLAKSYSLLELHLTFCLFSEALPDVTIQRYQYKHTLCDSRLQCFYTFSPH